MKKLIYFLFVCAVLLSGCNAVKKESGFTNVNGTNLYYEIAGSGEALVLIHGWSFDSRCWDDQFDVFAQKYRVLRYDLRGFGRSELPKLGHSYSHTNDLLALLDSLGIKRAHVLGHSFGGKIAIDFILHYPDRTISLILPDAAMDVIGLKVSKELSDWIGNTWRAGRKSGIDKAKEIWIKGSPLAPAMRNSRASAKVKKMIDEYSGWHWVNDDPSISPESYPVERLSEIKVPTLIIVGELNPYDYHYIADLQKQYIPNSIKIVLPNAGHALNIENPKKFNEIVLKYLLKLS
jgi:pimeloyl-ACP methyl ester carboxylesterase